MNTTPVIDYAALTDRYVALWNGDDDIARRRAIRELWTDDGAHVAPKIAVRGYEELEARVARSHQRWNVEQGCAFRSRGDATGHHNVARFTWEMLDRAGKVESVGTEIIVFNDEGKIVTVYQFVEV